MKRRIRNFPDYEIDTDGRIWNSKGIEIKGSIDSSTGYRVAMLKQNCERSKRKTAKFHTLVLTTFISQRPDGMEACHKNGIRTDNRLMNLRWGTSQENKHDRRLIDAEGHKLKQKQVRIIKWGLEIGTKKKILAFLFRVDACTISDIVKGRTWSHIRVT